MKTKAKHFFLTILVCSVLLLGTGVNAAAGYLAVVPDAGDEAAGVGLLPADAGLAPLRDGGAATASTGTYQSVAISANVIRVGINGTASVAAATVNDLAGGGFDFGYYAGRSFVRLGSLAARSVVVTAAGGRGVSLRLPTAYPSFTGAFAAASSVAEGFAAYIGESFYVLCGNYADAKTAEQAAAARNLTAEVYTPGAASVLASNDSGTVLVLYDGADTGLALVANGAASPLTGCGKYQYRGGFDFLAAGGGVTVVNVVGLEDYVAGVLASELNDQWPAEALKALACAARTFAVANIDKYLNYGFDLTAQAKDQVYLGATRVSGPITAAALATAGQCIVFAGQLITAMYFSSDGGGTRDSAEITSFQYPYLRGVTDPYESAVASVNPHAVWSERVSGERIAACARRLGYDVSALQTLELSHSAQGNVLSALLTDDAGAAVSISGIDCDKLFRSADYLGLHSMRFTASTGDGVSWDFSGGGWGHSVGLSQYGAYAMAQYYSKSYVEILQFYYTGVALAKGVVQ